MTKRNKALQKALKLAELAKRGIDGERDNARDQLQRIMAKHGITPEEVGEGYTQTFRFTVPLADQWLFSQVVTSVLGPVCMAVGDEDTIILIECAEEDVAIINQMMNHYMAAYQRELLTFNEAFILSQRLFPAPALKYARKEAPAAAWARGKEETGDMKDEIGKMKDETVEAETAEQRQQQMREAQEAAQRQHNAQNMSQLIPQHRYRRAIGDAPAPISAEKAERT